jgi:hypothetical protein
VTSPAAIGSSWSITSSQNITYFLAGPHPRSPMPSRPLRAFALAAAGMAAGAAVPGIGARLVAEMALCPLCPLWLKKTGYRNSFSSNRRNCCFARYRCVFTVPSGICSASASASYCTPSR